mgnify:CR=1 FL=1
MPEPTYGSVVAIPQVDGSTEWWELTDQWRLKRTDPPSSDMVSDSELATAIATHAALPNVHHPANVGITGTKTIGGFKFTFTNGLLTGFEPV